MSKRSREEEDTSRPPKRPRAEQKSQPPAVQEIEYARQLQQLLAFSQDGVQQLRNGIASFKAFLESVLYHRDEERRPRQLSILHEYLETQKPADLKDTERPFLGPLWQAWSFASQNHDDHAASAVSAIFALLLRTLSSLLDFRDYGLLLCRTVLQHQHLRLVKRGLDAPRHKEFVISPCVRLLTEVTSFDGGVQAKEVYKRREHTFDIATLRRNLGILKLGLIQHTIMLFTCLCDSTFETRTTLHEHVKAETHAFKCACGRYFKSLKSGRKHWPSHDRNHNFLIVELVLNVGGGEYAHPRIGYPDDPQPDRTLHFFCRFCKGPIADEGRLVKHAHCGPPL